MFVLHGGLLPRLSVPWLGTVDGDSGDLVAVWSMTPGVCGRSRPWSVSFVVVLDGGPSPTRDG
jgi:hypothetical protein